MNGFKEEPPELHNAMLQATQRVLKSFWYVLGEEVKQFENQWSNICGVNHGIGVGNGMDAIEIALRGLNVGVGDEVITTPITAFATILAILRSGATPVFADIEPNSALLSIDSVQGCFTKKTKAIVLVHLYGQVRSMEDWIAVCKQNNILLIEDCAQAHKAKWHGKVAGSFAHAGAYSFYPTKNLGAAGDAGMLVTQSFSLAKKARQLRNYGQSKPYFHNEIGMNSRLDEIHAAMLSERVKWLSEFTERRQNIAEVYHRNINNPFVKLLARPEEKSSHVYHLFVITCNNRNALQSHLLGNGIQTLIHYPVPSHKQKACLEINNLKDLPNSEEHASNCLSLPCHPQMSDKDVGYVVDSVNTYNEE